ncbi:HNH endonuclease, partial [Staphylococcus epidermidis]|uniref:HNH endonuclease n=1 Tax=Staphylococcus epidermidis TaxID=1282 RepID=UPI0030C26CE0
MWKDGKSHDFYVHRLVAGAFIPKVEGKNYINHKDGNPRNNEVNNLEWCTIAENNLHAHRTELNNNAYKVKLTRLKDGKKFYFETQIDASFFIGR